MKIRPKSRTPEYLVTGKTFPHKVWLKDQGCWWIPEKKAWGFCTSGGYWLSDFLEKVPAELVVTDCRTGEVVTLDSIIRKEISAAAIDSREIEAAKSMDIEYSLEHISSLDLMMELRRRGYDVQLEREDESDAVDDDDKVFGDATDEETDADALRLEAEAAWEREEEVRERDEILKTKSEKYWEDECARLMEETAREREEWDREMEEGAGLEAFTYLKAEQKKSWESR